MWVTGQVITTCYRFLQSNSSTLFVKFFNVIITASVNCSYWCFAFVALERMCLVLWPTNPIIRRAAFKESVIACSFLILFSAGLSATQNFCLNYGDSWQLVLDYILFHFLPLFISFISSAVFLYKIKTSTRIVNPDPQNQVNRPSVLPIKIVAVASTFVFIVLMPMMCMRIRQLFHKFEPFEMNIFQWFQITWSSNLTLKFFLYTIFIRHFRKGFVDICKKVKNKFIRNWNENIDKNVPKWNHLGLKK